MPGFGWSQYKSGDEHAGSSGVGFGVGLLGVGVGFGVGLLGVGVGFGVGLLGGVGTGVGGAGVGSPGIGEVLLKQKGSFPPTLDQQHVLI